MAQIELRFFLDGIPIQDNPVNWDELSVNLERDTELNGIFITYTDKLVFTGDGYDYLFGLIESSNFCGEVLIEIFQYLDGGRYIPGFGFRGIIDLSSSELNRQRGEITVPIEEDTLITVFKKYSDLEVLVNHPAAVTMNGEPLAPIGMDLRMMTPSLSIYPNFSGSDTIGFIYYSDLFQYVLDFIMDNRMTLSSDLLQVDKFEEYTSTITFDALGGGDTSVISYNDFAGNRQTFTQAGPRTAAQHASDFYHTVVWYTTDGGVLQNDMRKFPNINLAGAVAGIRLFHNPDFDTGAFATETILRPFIDGAANVGVTCPFYIQLQTVPPDTASIRTSFTDLYQEITDIYDAEIVFKKINGTYTLLVETREAFIQNSTPTITISDIINFTETIADDVIFRKIKYSAKVGSSIGTNPHQFLFKKCDYDISGCGSKDKRIDLPSYYGAEIHYNVIPGSNTSGDMLPIRTDDLMPGLYGAPLYWYAMYLTEFYVPFGAPAGYSALRWLPGDHAIHPLVVKRRLKTINAIASLNGYELESENDILINRKIKFDYPLSWSDFQTISSDPSNPIEIVFENGEKKKCWIKKIKHNVNTTMTNFELYTT